MVLLGVRRRLYCLVDAVFEPMSLDCKGSVVIRLSKGLTEELLTFVVLGPLAVVNLRAGFPNFMSANHVSSR